MMAVGAVCLIAWPSTLAAEAPTGDGGGTAPARLEFRFDKDVFAAPAAQTGIAGSERFSRLSIKLYGGFNYISAADINDGSDGYFELVEAYSALGYGTVSGGYRPLHGGYDFGADIICQLTPNIGLGLGAGYMRHSRGSEITWADETDQIAMTARPTVSAVPIRLGVFFTFPVARQLSLTADLGGAYYAGLKLEAAQRLEFAADDWIEMSFSGKRSDFSDLGFQGSLGFEYRFSPTMGFFLEAAGRYAKLKNFETVANDSEESGGATNTGEGMLYIIEYNYTDLAYSTFSIEEVPPVDDPPEVTYREPKIDLSGFSLQAGIRIRF